MHTLVVMHRRTLRENLDSAKIRCLFILQVSIFYTWIDTSCRYTFDRCIDQSISMERYTPVRQGGEMKKKQSLEIFFKVPSKRPQNLVYFL